MCVCVCVCMCVCVPVSTMGSTESIVDVDVTKFGKRGSEFSHLLLTGFDL